MVRISYRLPWNCPKSTQPPAGVPRTLPRTQTQLICCPRSIPRNTGSQSNAKTPTAFTSKLSAAKQRNPKVTSFLVCVGVSPLLALFFKSSHSNVWQSSTTKAIRSTTSHIVSKESENTGQMPVMVAWTNAVFAKCLPLGNM